MTNPSDDPLSAFELPPEVMSATFEHAISDMADDSHERGHAIAAALQKALKGSSVEYGFPGLVTVHFASGAVARCGGPDIGWLIDLQPKAGGAHATMDVDIPNGETDPAAIAALLAKRLRKY